MEESTWLIDPALEETFLKYHGLQTSISILQNEDITVRILVIEIGKKVRRGFKYIFHTYFMRGLQKYQGK